MLKYRQPSYAFVMDALWIFKEINLNGNAPIKWNKDIKNALNAIDNCDKTFFFLQSSTFDNSRFRWAIPYHALQTNLTKFRKYTLHCINSVTDSYNRGILIRSKELSDKTSLFYEPGSDTEFKRKVKIDGEEFETFQIITDDTGTFVKRSGESVGSVLLEAKQNVHPAFQNRSNNCLFHCLPDAFDVHLKDEVIVYYFAVAEPGFSQGGAR